MNRTVAQLYVKPTLNGVDMVKRIYNDYNALYRGYHFNIIIISTKNDESNLIAKGIKKLPCVIINNSVFCGTESVLNALSSTQTPRAKQRKQFSPTFQDLLDSEMMGNEQENDSGLSENMSASEISAAKNPWGKRRPPPNDPRLKYQQKQQQQQQQQQQQPPPQPQQTIQPQIPTYGDQMTIDLKKASTYPSGYEGMDTVGTDGQDFGGGYDNFILGQQLGIDTEF